MGEQGQNVRTRSEWDKEARMGERGQNGRMRPEWEFEPEIVPQQLHNHQSFLLINCRLFFYFYIINLLLSL